MSILDGKGIVERKEIFEKNGYYAVINKNGKTLHVIKKPDYLKDFPKEEKGFLEYLQYQADEFGLHGESFCEMVHGDLK